jgi:hypothetical protein
MSTLDYMIQNKAGRFKAEGNYEISQRNRIHSMCQYISSDISTATLLWLTSSTPAKENTPLCWIPTNDT